MSLKPYLAPPFNLFPLFSCRSQSKKMKSLFTSFFVSMVSLCSISLFAQVQVPSIDSIKAMQANFQSPAVGIGIIEDGQLNQIIVSGDLEAGKPAPFNSIFNVASITKSITALVTLKLVDQGKWELDAPVFPYWVDPEVKDDPNHKKLTTRHILSHQSGFKNWRWMNEDKKLAFDFEPGTQFGYSGEGFEYLRKALENKFGTTLDALAQELVFDPFQMVDSRLIWDKNMDENRYALPHKNLKEAYELEKRMGANAADDLLTTVEDLGRFGAAIIQGAGLKPRIFEEMVRPQSTGKPGVDFGFGWISFQNLPNEEYALLSAGSDKGVNAIILLLPKSKRGLVAISNSDPGRAMVMQLIAKVFGETGGAILGRF